MGRKSVEINPKCGERLSEWLTEAHMTQANLAEKIGYTQQHISNIIRGKKNMTPDFAQLVSEKAPKLINGADFICVRTQWLLCMDEFKTEGDRTRSIGEKYVEEDSLIEKLIELHGYEVGEYLQWGQVDDEGQEYAIPLVSIKAPNGAIRYFQTKDYKALIKGFKDYLEGQLLLKFHRPKDGAKEYTGGLF